MKMCFVPNEPTYQEKEGMHSMLRGILGVWHPFCDWPCPALIKLCEAHPVMTANNILNVSKHEVSQMQTVASSTVGLPKLEFHRLLESYESKEICN